MIKPLTSLRFFFAFMVFTSHLSFLKKSESSFIRWVYNSILDEGYIGVSFFFILSGFILSYSYQDDFLKNKKSKKTFYQARFARIFPLHILTFIISLPLSYNLFIHHKSLWASQAITNLSLTQSYIPLKEIYFSFNAPSWSISDEMFFYIVFPFLVLLIPKIKTFKKFIILLIVTLPPLLTLVISKNYYHHLFYISPFLRIMDFILGILLFNTYKTVLLKKRNINYNYLEIYSILSLLVFFIFHQYIPEVARYSFYYWIPMSFLIFSFSFQKGRISKLLSQKRLVYLGEISFGFYMFHQLVIRYFLVINSKFIHISNNILIILITFIISVILSYYSYIFFEKPTNRYIKRILKTTPKTL